MIVLLLVWLVVFCGLLAFNVAVYCLWIFFLLLIVSLWMLFIVIAVAWVDLLVVVLLLNLGCLCFGIDCFVGLVLVGFGWGVLRLCVGCVVLLVCSCYLPLVCVFVIMFCALLVGLIVVIVV